MNVLPPWPFADYSTGPRELSVLTLGTLVMFVLTFFLTHNDPRAETKTDALLLALVQSSTQ